MQHGVGRSAHRHVKSHGVAEGLLRGNAARGGRIVFVLVVAARQIHDRAASLEEEFAARTVRGQR